MSNVWNKETENVNTWDEKNFQIYVLDGYWQAGYVVDSKEQWVENSTNQNVWVKTNG